MMRVFLCDYSGFSLAIPMSSVSALTLYEDNQKEGNTYISLPALFDLPGDVTRHGVILKNGDDDDHNIDENRTVLLTTEIKCEKEIADEEIYPLPKIFDNMSFSGMFSGIQINSSVVLLLDPEQLVQNIDKIERQKDLTL